MHALLALLAVAWHPDTGNVPLNDLGAGFYKGFQGGLYPGGSNVVPASHLSAALALAAGIVPRDAAGMPNAQNGKIGMITIGMSNTTQESAPFERNEDLNGFRNARVEILNCAVGGQTAHIIADPSANYWNIVAQRIAAMGLNANQIQIAWLKEANANPPNDFPGHAQTLRDDLIQVVRNLRQKFPHLTLCYVSSRIYGGYANTPLNPEPQAYESGFSVKWLIEAQISGDSRLSFANPPNAPLLLWGPYMWADGLTPRSDGLVWMANEFESDGTHPSTLGENHVADLLAQFFAADSTCQVWFKPQPGYRLVAVSAAADASVRSDQPNANFGSDSSLTTAEGSYSEKTYLKFDLRGVAGQIVSAKLSLRVASGGGGILSAVTNSGWQENSITWNNAPPVDGGTITQIPMASRESTICAETAAVVNSDPDKLVTFALSAPSGLQTYVSKEGGQPPRLILIVKTKLPTSSGGGVPPPSL